MRIGLFIPCYVDQFYPDVGLATVDLLERFGCEVEFPEAQTCCGQPMANTGCWSDAAPLARKFVDIFEQYDHIVCPSGSCVSMVTHHYETLLPEDDAGYLSVKKKTWELSQFLVDVLKVQDLGVEFPYRVGLHNSCHGLRDLRLGGCSERMEVRENKAVTLLNLVKGLELVPLTRPDECCGFGGTFAVAEEAVSCMMGNDRIQDHEQAGAQIITAGDMSCLMHLEGLLRRQKKPIAVMHLAQILAGRSPSAGLVVAQSAVGS
ncbi:(Fe-S)-binding protein [Planctomicrobium sp. SH668]|uniref:(Fe-S)-binding protein n=1 Tax=Planctomicrobium sp. SH668 TaxID=3448126 RepID=UPI003F5BC547